jgi:hypothetical protein
MIRVHYAEVALAIANAKSLNEREGAARLVCAYYATPATEPTSERIRLLRQALELEASKEQHRL